MRERNSAATYEPLRRVGTVFGIAGALLFMRVWWPIQAERNLQKLRKVETQIFQKKSELNILNERYSAMTSLTVLDQWAKKHGTWVPAGANNVIPIE